MKRVTTSIAVLGMLFLVGCDDGDGGGSSPPGSSGSTFSGTFVPYESIGGIRLGDTYEAVKAAHGEPDSMVGARPPDSPVEGVVYGPTTPWAIQLSFRDADGDGQLSGADTVDSITGSDYDMQGLFKYAGVGTGSTEAETVAVLGQPYGRNVNQNSPDLSSAEYYKNNFSKAMILDFEGGICHNILIF